MKASPLDHLERLVEDYYRVMQNNTISSKFPAYAVGKIVGAIEMTEVLYYDRGMCTEDFQQMIRQNPIIAPILRELEY